MNILKLVNNNADEMEPEIRYVNADEISGFCFFDGNTIIRTHNLAPTVITGDWTKELAIMLTQIGNGKISTITY